MCRAAGLYTEAVEVDHIKPRHRGGAIDDVSNLQPLCTECHAAKTDKEGSQETKKQRFGACLHGTPAGRKCEKCL